MMALMLCFSFVSFAGNKDTLKLSDVYLSGRMITEQTFTYDSISRKQLVEKFENWAGQHFRNYEETRTSKTESQITLRYITTCNIVTSGDWYINLTIIFEDNKMTVKAYDDGNGYQPSWRNGSTYIPAIQAHTYHFDDYFTDELIIYKPTESFFNNKEKQARNIKLTVSSVKNFIESINN